MSIITIYTDGAYSSLKNQGGVGIVFLKDDKKIFEYGKMFPNTTNNQMELAALIIGLKSIKLDDVELINVISDSKYVIGCASLGWQRRKNKNLWKQYDEIQNKILEKGIEIKFHHVKGHNGDKYNELADQLAVISSQEIV